MDSKITSDSGIKDRAPFQDDDDDDDDDDDERKKERKGSVKATGLLVMASGPHGVGGCSVALCRVTVLLQQCSWLVTQECRSYTVARALSACTGPLSIAHPMRAGYHHKKAGCHPDLRSFGSSRNIFSFVLEFAEESFRNCQYHIISFEKGLADRGGWREEILPLPEIQAPFLHPFSYLPLRRRESKPSSSAGFRDFRKPKKP